MATLPRTMKGVIIRQTGGTDVLEYRTDLPVPQATEGQLLIQNDLVGINYIDTYFRSGLYPPPHFPYTLGREGEGTVVATGPNGTQYGLRVGDRAVWMGDGGYAEYSRVAATTAVKVPPEMGTGVAAAGLLQGLTALTLVREAHVVRKGDWVLVHAAAGGTGLWLVRLLKGIGARTIGTVGSAEKGECAREAGAEVVVDYGREDVRRVVEEWTGKQGVVAVFDGVGKDTFDLSLDVLARKGSLVSFGNASGVVPPVTIARLSAKNVRLMRPTLFGYVATREEFERYVHELFDWILKEKLEVKIHDVYPLSQVARAHEDLQGRKTTGKLLLDPTK